MSALLEPTAERRPLSVRKRKLRLTLFVLVSLAFGGSLFGMAWFWWKRPKQYAPGETSAEITSALSKRLPPNASTPSFADITSQSGLSAFRNFTGLRTSQLPEDTGPGLAWGDFDNDGDDDLFLVSAGGALNLSTNQLLPCELYENIGNGKFQKYPGFPDLRIHGMGAAWGDFDGDGDLDLVVSGYNALYLFRNDLVDGKRKFTRIESFPNPKGFWTGVTWGDFDRDGHLDLYVCGYLKYAENEEDRVKGSDQLGAFVPYTLNPASYEPGLNMLLHNNRDGTFTDVASELGVTNPTGRSLGALWHDFDDDGWLDLYVANDVSDNAFYHNTGGKFEEISHAAWVADYRSAMGLTAGDYDHDGDDDLYITHWVAQENALYENHWADFNKTAIAQGKQLYPLRFTDVNEMRGLGQVSLPFVGWGTEFADFDGDGWPDLIVANGSTIEEPNSDPKKLQAQEPFLFWNRKGEFFHDIAPANKSLSEKHVSRGLALADFDNDGDLDIAIAQLGEGVQLLRNDMQTGHWLELRLRNRTVQGARGFGTGSRVEAYADGTTHRRTVSSASYLSQSSHTVHIGLGEATNIDRVEVDWLGGGTNIYRKLAADARYDLVEGAAEAEVTQRSVTTNARPIGEKDKLMEFWRAQRAGMNALKVDKNLEKAITNFRDALAYNPKHEDTHYYLAQALAGAGQIEAALVELETLQKLNPQSHRAFQQWGNLRAVSAKSPDQLSAAEKSLQRAREINPEETGALLILGEISLLKGDLAEADARLLAVSATNQRSVGALFLRGYLAFRRGDTAEAAELLKKTREALGKEWQPKGATAEGDVKQKQHIESSPLHQFYDEWNGLEDPAAAYASLRARLR